jgi:hypothetical protein
MSFVKINAEDFVVSADSITSTLWSDNTTTLVNYYTSSTTITNNAYLPVYGVSTVSNPSALPQFTISYGQVNGSGSAPINASISGLSPTRITYGQFRTLINGDENTNLNFGVGNSNSPDFYVINISRANYKEKLFLSTFNLALSGSDGTVESQINLTNNSTTTTTLTYCDAGRVFDIVSGSNGTATTLIPISSSAAGYTVSGSYGKFLPDVGLILLNARALALSASFGGIGLIPSTGSTSVDLSNTNAKLLGAMINGRNNIDSAGFSLNSEETITSDYIFVRIKNSDFNYTTNPSMISGSGEFYYPSLINNPQTFITTVGLYNDNNELLGVAKLSKPLVKDFTKEALIRVKLDF